jgi:hypothetical protein
LTQGVPVELEAEPSGAGYLSKSVDGIAAKVLLEQAQEAAQIARKRLEKAAEYHNQVGGAAVLACKFMCGMFCRMFA